MIGTIITWHKAKDELPEKSCEVLVLCAHNKSDNVFIVDITKENPFMFVNYSNKYKAFNATDEDGDDYKLSSVVYWAGKDDIGIPSQITVIN